MLPSLWRCRVECVDDVGQNSNNNSLTWRSPPLHPYTSNIFSYFTLLTGNWVVLFISCEYSENDT